MAWNCNTASVFDTNAIAPWEQLVTVTRCIAPNHYARAFRTNTRVFATGPCGVGKSTHAIKQFIENTRYKVCVVAPTMSARLRTMRSLYGDCGISDRRLYVSCAQAFKDGDPIRAKALIRNFDVIILDDIHVDEPSVAVLVQLIRAYADKYILITATPSNDNTRLLAGVTREYSRHADLRWVSDPRNKLAGTVWDPNSWGTDVAVTIYPVTREVLARLKRYYESRGIRTRRYDGRSYRVQPGVTFVMCGTDDGATIDSQRMIDTGWTECVVEANGVWRTDVRPCNAVERSQRHGRIGRNGFGRIVCSSVPHSTVKGEPNKLLQRVNMASTLASHFPRLEAATCHRPRTVILLGSYGLPYHAIDATIRGRHPITLRSVRAGIRHDAARELFNADSNRYALALIAASACNDTSRRIVKITAHIRDVARVVGVNPTIAAAKALMDFSRSHANGYTVEFDGKEFGLTCDREHVISEFCGVVAWMRQLSTRLVDLSAVSNKHLAGFRDKASTSIGARDYCYLHGTRVGEASRPGPKSSTFLSTVTRWVQSRVGGAVFVRGSSFERYRYSSFKECNDDSARWCSTKQAGTGRCLVVWYEPTEYSDVYFTVDGRSDYITLVGLDVLPMTSVDWNAAMIMTACYINFGLNEVSRQVAVVESVSPGSLSEVAFKPGYTRTQNLQVMGGSARRHSARTGMPIDYMQSSQGEPFGVETPMALNDKMVAESTSARITDITAHVLLVFVEENPSARTRITVGPNSRRYDSVSYAVYPMLELPEAQEATVTYINNGGVRCSYDCYFIDDEPVPDESLQRCNSMAQRNVRPKAEPSAEAGNTDSALTEPVTGADLTEFIPVPDVQSDAPSYPLGTRYYQAAITMTDAQVRVSALGDEEEPCNDGEADKPGPMQSLDELPIFDILDQAAINSIASARRANRKRAKRVVRVGEAKNPGPVSWRTGVVPEALLSAKVTTEADGRTYSDDELSRIETVFGNYENFIVNFLMYMIRTDGSHMSAETSVFDHKGKKVTFARVFEEAANELHTKKFHARRFARSIAKFLVDLYNRHEAFNMFRDGTDTTLKHGNTTSIYFCSWAQDIAPNSMALAIRRFNATKTVVNITDGRVDNFNVLNEDHIGGNNTSAVTRTMGGSRASGPSR